MKAKLLQEINLMRADLVHLVEEGLSVQDSAVIEKSQALDVLISTYFQNHAGCFGRA